MNNISKKFTALLIPFYAMYATGPSFFVVVLEQKGIPAQYIGLYTSILAVAATVAQPAFGFLTDKTGKAKEILIFCCTTSVLAYTWLVFLQGTVQLVLCCVVIGLCMNSMYGFSESWLSKLDCDKLGVNFGAVRSMGSLAYAVTAAAYGIIFDIFGQVSMPAVMAICLAVIIAVAVICPNPQVAKGTAGGEKITLKETASYLKGNKMYLAVLVCYTLAMLPTGAAFTYYPVHISYLGGTAASVGIAMFVLAGSEFISMALYKKFENKFGTRTLLIFAFAMFGIKNLAIGFSATVTQAVLAAVTQALCFAIAIPAVQSFVDKAVDRKYNSVAQLICNTGGLILAGIPGAIIAGWLINYMTAGMAMAIMSVFAFLASFVFYLASKEKKA